MTTPSERSSPHGSATPWSRDLQLQTRKALEEFSCNPLTGRLHLKNINGTYGWIEVLDLMAGNLAIHTADSETGWTAPSIDELLKAGWAID